MEFVVWLLLGQDAGAVDAAVKSVMGLDVRKIRPVDDAAFRERAARDLWGGPAAGATTIDELLASPKFAEHWGRRLAGWFDVPGLEPWMIEAVYADRPWNETASAMILGKGPWTRGTELESALDVGRHFLGVRLYCGTCHDHPYDRWTLRDVYGLAAFFSEKDLRLPDLGADPDAKVKLATGESVGPSFPFGGGPAAGEPRREALARLLTSKANTQFPRAFANRVWAELFGRGLVDPPDDFNLRNKAISTPLLDAVTRVFVDGGYRLKPLLRVLLASQIYRCEDLTVAAQAEWSSFRGLLARPPDPALRAFKPFILDLPPSWTALGRQIGFASAWRVPAKEGTGGGRFGSMSSGFHWVKQIAGAKPTTEVLEGPVKVTLTEAAGTYTCDPTSFAPRQNWRVLHARLERGADRKYVLLEGPSGLVLAWKGEFLEMLRKAGP